MHEREKALNAIYNKVVLPLTAQHCEEMHRLTLRVLELAQLNQLFLNAFQREFGLDTDLPDLSVEVFGVKFPTPFIIAAGLDKDARAASSLSAMGVGGVEVGSFTGRQWSGNPSYWEEKQDNGTVFGTKRLVRFNPDQTIYNWMGLRGIGAATAAINYDRQRDKFFTPVGISVAICPGLTNPDERREDLNVSVENTYRLKPQWLTFNVSCPNGGETGDAVFSRTLAEMQCFIQLCQKEKSSHHYDVPLLLKIGPDMSIEKLETLVKAAKDNGYDGIIVGNTTTNRRGEREKYSQYTRGGLSGQALYDLTLSNVKEVSRVNREYCSKPLVIIACGGINSVEKWLEMKEAGATLCQVLSGFIFGGPYWFSQLNRELAKGSVSNPR